MEERLIAMVPTLPGAQLSFDDSVRAMRAFIGPSDGEPVLAKTDQSGALTLVNPRVRGVIESVAPGVHYFVPIDIDDRTGGMSDGGQPRVKYPGWLTNTDRFFWLNGSVIDGASLLYDARLGWLFSREIVERLRDCLPKGKAFAPMGLV